MSHLLHGTKRVLTVALPAVTMAAVAFYSVYSVAALAQDKPAASAVSGWTTDTKPAAKTEPRENEEQAEDASAAKPPISLSSEQISLLARINEYLNSLVNVEGRFIQTDHRNEETKGRFYVRRPGRLRFDYSSPSRLRIVSDGEYLSVEDHDLRTVDKFPLDATPIQLLLGKDVNLTRDAKQDENAVVVTLRDRSGTAAGHLQLFFKRPEIELYEWVITDAQGLDTRVQLANLHQSEEKKSDEFFASSDIELERLTNN